MWCMWRETNSLPPLQCIVILSPSTAKAHFCTSCRFPSFFHFLSLQNVSHVSKTPTFYSTQKGQFKADIKISLAPFLCYVCLFWFVPFPSKQVSFALMAIPPYENSSKYFPQRNLDTGLISVISQILLSQTIRNCTVPSHFCLDYPLKKKKVFNHPVSKMVTKGHWKENSA